MSLFKKHAVFQAKKFIVAYSSKPFCEAKKRDIYPNYSFFESDGLYWCVRVGELEVPWGIGASSTGGRFSANGTIVVSRQNVDASSFDGKDLMFTKCGDIYYLYESELVNGRFEGYVIYLRDAFLATIGRIANNSEAKTFPDILEQSLRDDPKFSSLLKEQMLVLKRVDVSKVTEGNRSTIPN